MEQTESFSIPKSHFKGRDCHFRLLKELTTTSHLLPPYYAQINQISGPETEKIVGVKTNNKITLISLKGNDYDEGKEITLADDKVKNESVSYFCFSEESYQPDAKPKIIYCFKTGLIAIYDCQEEKILEYLNINTKTEEIIRKMDIFKIIPIPWKSNQYLIIFRDSSLMKVYGQKSETNLKFIERLRNMERKLNINNLSKEKFKSKKKDHIKYGVVTDYHSKELNHFYIENKSETLQNPISFHYFNVRTIADITVVKRKSLIPLLNLDLETSDDTFIAFVTLDGFFIILSYDNMKALFTYKSSWGGFHFLTFHETKNWVLLGGQDDSFSLFDLNTMRSLKFEGSKSFVYKAIFQEIKYEENGEEKKDQIPQYNRIISGSLDSEVIFWEVKDGVFKTIPWIDHKTLGSPIRLKQNFIPEQKISRSLFSKAFKESIGHIQIINNLLIVCTYDGLISSYVISDNSQSSSQNSMNESYEDLNREDEIINYTFQNSQNSDEKTSQEQEEKDENDSDEEEDEEEADDPDEIEEYLMEYSIADSTVVNKMKMSEIKYQKAL